MAEHEINTIINVEARAKGSGTGGLGSVSKQLSNIANLSRVLRSSKELKDLPTIFADAHKHASAFVGSLGGVNKQLEQTVGHLKSLKGLGGVIVGAPAATSGAKAAAAAASTTVASGGAKGGAAKGGKGGRPKAPVSAAVAAAQQAREKAKIAKIEAAALRDLAAVDALEYRANQHLQTAGKVNKDRLPPDEAKARKQRERDHRKGYEAWWKKELKAQDAAIAAKQKADKKLENEKIKQLKAAEKAAETQRKKAERADAAAKKKVEKEAEKARLREAKEAAKVDRELAIFETGFEGRAERRRQEARKKRRGAFRQGFFQGVGGPQFLQRDLTLAQVGGYAVGGALRGGATIGGRAIGAGFAGATGGAESLIQAVGNLGRGIPVLEGAGEAVGAALTRSYQAAQRGLEFRRASNALFLAERLATQGSAGLVSPDDPFRERGPFMFGGSFKLFSNYFKELPQEQQNDDEMFRRQYEEARAADAKKFATPLGMGVTEYLQSQRRFGRVAGYKAAVETEGMFPTSLGISRVTGLDEEIVGRLAQKLFDDEKLKNALSGGSFAALSGMNAAARLDRMALSPFVQAIRDGLNESDATEVLQDIAQQTIRGADLQVGSNAFMATMALSSSLAKTGAVSPKTAYNLTRGLGQKSQSLAFGAKSSSDLLMLKFFGDLDLGAPISPSAYNKAVAAAASTKNLEDPKRFERLLRFLMNRMGGRPDVAAAGVSAEVNRMLDSQVLDIGGAERLLQTISTGKGLTAADLSAAGAVLPGLQLAEQATSFAEKKKADTANREILAGRKLLDTMTKLDEATARMVENVQTFEKELDTVADIIVDFGDGISAILKALRDPKGSAVELFRQMFNFGG